MKDITLLRVIVVLVTLLTAVLVIRHGSPNKIAVNDAEYLGHNYLIFKVKGNFGQTFIHDPDCKCHAAERQVEK